MKKRGTKSKVNCSLILCLTLILSGCIQMSQKETDVSAGLNGGFEITQNGLPVNWLMYTSKTVPDSDFTIELDKEVFVEGEQALKFDVKKCSSTGGWNSPGFTNEFTETGQFEGPGIFNLSFWIKNDGSKYQVSAGGVSPYKGDMKVLVEDYERTEGWKYLNYEIDLPEDRHLRVQLNILEAGTFWIDDIQVKRK